MKTNYRKATEEDYEIFAKMVKEYYEEDSTEHGVNDSKICRTYNEFRNKSEKGSIYIFEKSRKIVGYAILVYYWSNEYGGNVLNIDELFVKPNFRGEGIGTSFLQFLMEGNLGYDFVAMALEVSQENIEAEKLYKRIGFKQNTYKSYIFEKGR